MRIAILQPTFLPWLGWFDIVDQVDLLVILDDVAFSKQSWQQRNRLRTPKGLEFSTVPVRTAGRLGQPIGDVEIADPRFAEKMERTIVSNYARTPYFDVLFPSFQETLLGSTTEGKLAHLNIQMIDWISNTLGIHKNQRASSTIEVNGRRGEYVAALCTALSAKEYLSPAGAETYLFEDRHAFEQRGIGVWLHEYAHPNYHQAFQPFMPYASTLDLLFNEGPRALDIIRSGRRTPRALGVPALHTTTEKIHEAR